MTNKLLINTVHVEATTLHTAGGSEGFNIALKR